MSSERSKLKENVNESKNTRMDVDSAISRMDVRKDELMHLGRYQKAVQTAVSLSKTLGRPIRILDLGCGEIYTMRTLYKSFQVKKSDVVKQYIGIDIDDGMLSRVKTQYEKVLTAVNGKVIVKDITVDPKLKVKDDYFDLIVWFEMIEHVKPEFIPPMFEELHRVLSPEGIMLVSTPNATGSNAKLPKDHVYEWGYDELVEVMERNFELVCARGVCINISKIPAEEKAKKARTIKQVYEAFGENTAFSSTVLGPMFPPKYCKNVIYTLRKE
jgi:ubiquinone/menaquinone biosynthesis C-methylase UbiE